MRCTIKLLALFAVLSLYAADGSSASTTTTSITNSESSLTCIQLNCPVCCVEDSSGNYCSTDTLTCQLDTAASYSMLIKTVIIIAGFLIGIPIVLLVLELLVLKRIACLKMSVCEIIVNGLCLCQCLRKKRENPKFGVKKSRLNAKGSSRAASGVIEMGS